MDTILQQLYDGKIFPAEQYRPTVEEYKKLYKKHYQHYEDFIKELSQLQKPLDTRFVEIVKIAVLAHTARSTRAILPKQESHLAGWLNSGWLN